MKKIAKLHAALVNAVKTNKGQYALCAKFQVFGVAEAAMWAAVTDFGGEVIGTNSYLDAGAPYTYIVKCDGAIVAKATIYRSDWSSDRPTYYYVGLELINRATADRRRAEEKASNRAKNAQYMSDRAAVITALEMGGMVEYTTGQEYGIFRLPEGNPVSARRTLMAMGYSDAKARQMLEAAWNDSLFSINANDRISGRPGSLEWEMTA